MKEVKRNIMILIEPFMDKTPCVWAYIKKHKTMRDLNGRQIGAIDYSEHLEDYEIIIDYFTSGSTIRRKTEMKQVEELWGNYDITALEKYIESITNWLYIAYTPNNYYRKLMIEDWMNAIHSVWQIPNKPLSLYSSEEEKDLLELLNKLWTNQTIKI